MPKLGKLQTTQSSKPNTADKQSIDQIEPKDNNQSRNKRRNNSVRIDAQLNYKLAALSKLFYQSSVADGIEYLADQAIDNLSDEQRKVYDRLYSVARDTIRKRKRQRKK